MSWRKFQEESSESVSLGLHHIHSYMDAFLCRCGEFMAVTVVIGATQSGKSRMVEKSIVGARSRVVVFDVVQCFSSLGHRLSIDEQFGLDSSSLEKLFQIAVTSPGFFRVGLSPGKKTDYQKALDRIITSCFIIGERVASAEKPLLLVVDEAGEFMSSQFQTEKLNQLVRRGRHFHCDSLFIAQMPQNIHPSVRANASRVVCFRLTTAPENSFITSLMGREIAAKIRDLPRYHYVTWEDTGKVTITDERGKIYYRKD